MKLIRIMAIIAIVLLTSFLGPFLYLFLFSLLEQVPTSPFDWTTEMTEWNHTLHIIQLILAIAALLLSCYFAWRLVHPALACLLLLIYGSGFHPVATKGASKFSSF